MKQISIKFGSVGIGLVILSTVLGCGSTPRQTAQLEWHQPEAPRTTSDLDVRLKEVRSGQFKKAATELKKVNIATLSKADRDMYGYLTARISYATNNPRGCQMLTTFALNDAVSNLDIRAEARAHASRCLQPPQACDALASVTKPYLDQLEENARKGLFDRFATCPNAASLVQAVIHERSRLSADSLTIKTLLQRLLAHQDQSVIHHIWETTADTPWLRVLSGSTLLRKFGRSLPFDDQLKIAKELPQSHPDLKAWQQTSNQVVISLCLPLSGSFGSVGQKLMEDLKLIKERWPALIEASLQFEDCSASQWRPNAYRQRLGIDGIGDAQAVENDVGSLSTTQSATQQKPHFVISAASPKIQRQMTNIHRQSNAPFHISLNRLRSAAPSQRPQKTLSLHQEADVLVGTLITDAMTTLKRTPARTFPLNLLVVSDADQLQPAGKYLHKHRKLFANYRRMLVPKPCPTKPIMERKECLVQRTAHWEKLAAEIETINRSSSPNEVIYFDVDPKNLIELLTYLAAERVKEPRHQTHAPLLYTNEAPLAEVEGEVTSIDEKEGTSIVYGYKNRFTRQAARYAEGMKFLVHNDPTNPKLHSLMADVEAALGRSVGPDTVRAVEGIGLLCNVVKQSRNAMETVDAAGKRGVKFGAFTSGLEFTPYATRALPRLVILTIKNGEFRRE